MTTIERFQANANIAYERYLAQCKRAECLGERAKMQSGKFGAAELFAHKTAATFLGRHEAYTAAALILMEESTPTDKA